MKAFGKKIVYCLTHLTCSQEIDQAQGWGCPVFGCHLDRIYIKTYALLEDGSRTSCVPA